MHLHTRVFGILIASICASFWGLVATLSFGLASVAQAQTSTFVVDSTASEVILGSQTAPLSGSVTGNYTPGSGSVLFSGSPPNLVSLNSGLFTFQIPTTTQTLGGGLLSVKYHGEWSANLSGMSFSILSGTASQGAAGNAVTWLVSPPPNISTPGVDPGTFAGTVLVEYNFLGNTQFGTFSFSGDVTPTLATGAGVIGLQETAAGATLTLSVHSVLSFTNLSFSGTGLIGDAGELVYDTLSQYANETFGDAAPFAAYVVATAPIPEPETYAMLLAGLGLLGFAARRRRLQKVI